MIQADVDYHSEFSARARRKGAVESVRRIFKRLHRIQDLSIANWAGFLEEPLTKYATYHAPILRRFALSNADEFAGFASPASNIFPFIISSSCPVLQVLALKDVGLSSIRPNLLPSLRKLHLVEVRSRTPREALLTVLESLPLLRYLSITQIFSDDEETLNTPETRSIVLGNLTCLKLVDAALYLANNITLSAQTYVDLRAGTHIVNDVLRDETELMCALLAEHLSRLSSPTNKTHKPLYGVCIDCSLANELSLQARFPVTPPSDTYPSMHLE